MQLRTLESHEVGLLGTAAEPMAASTTICLSDGQSITGAELQPPPERASSRLLRIEASEVEIPVAAQGTACSGQLHRVVPFRKLKRVVLADFQTLYGQPKQLETSIRVGLLDDSHVYFSYPAIRTWGEPTGLEGYSEYLQIKETRQIATRPWLQAAAMVVGVVVFVGAIVLVVKAVFVPPIVWGCVSGHWRVDLRT